MLARTLLLIRVEMLRHSALGIAPSPVPETPWSRSYRLTSSASSPGSMEGFPWVDGSFSPWEHEAGAWPSTAAMGEPSSSSSGVVRASGSTPVLRRIRQKRPASALDAFGSCTPVAATGAARPASQMPHAVAGARAHPLDALQEAAIDDIQPSFWLAAHTKSRKLYGLGGRCWDVGGVTN